MLVGPIRVQLQRAANPAMVADFLNPSPAAVDGDGIVTACFQDAIEQVAVKDNIGKRIPIGRTGASLEIVEFLPNARPDNMGRFVSKGEAPTNPMLELRVHLPEENEPLRQIAFAKDGLLNLDGVYGRVCPVIVEQHRGPSDQEHGQQVRALATGLDGGFDERHSLV